MLVPISIFYIDAFFINFEIYILEFFFKVGNKIETASVSQSDSLPASLEKVFENAKKEKEDLEAKLNNAKQTREKISSLESSDDFLSQEDLDQIEMELSFQRSIIFRSWVAESEVAELKEKIAKIELSQVIVLPDEKHLIEKRIETMQESVTKARQIQEEIFQFEKDSCSEADIEKLAIELNAIKTILSKLQPGNLNYNTGHKKRLFLKFKNSLYKSIG